MRGYLLLALLLVAVLTLVLPTFVDPTVSLLSTLQHAVK